VPQHEGPDRLIVLQEPRAQRRVLLVAAFVVALFGRPAEQVYQIVELAGEFRQQRLRNDFRLQRLAALPGQGEGGKPDRWTQDLNIGSDGRLHPLLDLSEDDVTGGQRERRQTAPEAAGARKEERADRNEP